MQPLSGNQRPDLLTYLTHLSLVPRLPREKHLCRSSSHLPRLPSFLKLLQSPRCSLLTRCTIRCACHAKRHLNVQKWSDTVSVLHFCLRNVLRATPACAFSTSQLPKVVPVLCTFDFEMCFVPQRRALFLHLNFQKWSEHAVFNFSSLIRPDGSAPAALASTGQIFPAPEPQVIGKTQ